MRARDSSRAAKAARVILSVSVPTMVFGLYGMNFEFMPELKWRFGYPLIVVMVVVVCAALYRRFKRAGWL